MLPRTLKKPGRAVRSFACCALLILGVAAKLSSKIAAINTEYFLSFIAGTPFYGCHFGFLFSARQAEKDHRAQIFKVSETSDDKDVTGNAQKQKKIPDRFFGINNYRRQLWPLTG
jgi:hypothetical protein